MTNPSTNSIHLLIRAALETRRAAATPVRKRRGKANATERPFDLPLFGAAVQSQRETAG